MAISTGAEIARGLVAYDMGDAKRIAGLKSSEIERVLGYKYLDEVVHRNDLVLLDTAHDEPTR